MLTNEELDNLHEEYVKEQEQKRRNIQTVLVECMRCLRGAQHYLDETDGYDSEQLDEAYDEIISAKITIERMVGSYEV